MSMQLAPDFTFRPLPSIEKLIHLPFPEIPHPLGPLVHLPGTWVGYGFNQIWRPFHSTQNPQQDRFLELNLTNETLQFEEISGAIPNRGLLQADINMFGVHYLQQIKDHAVGAALHFEPGIWLTVPATTNPHEPPTVARLGSIPHGTSILAQGIATTVAGPPHFAPVDITPFRIGNPGAKIHFPESNLSQPSSFRSADPGITQGMVDNPNSVLQAAIAGQTITQTTVLEITSDRSGRIAGGGTANTAFLQGTPTSPPNADAALVTAIFWIESVKGAPGHPDFLQLQYTQTVLLNFNGLSWPHVSVATLKRVVPQTPSIQRVDPSIPADLLKSLQEPNNP